jgi:predicted cobalt transporter CbtA
MVARLLLCGMIVGVLAGILAFSFSHLFGESQIEQAIALEGGTNGTHDHSTHDHDATDSAGSSEPFSRQTQAGVGLLTGLVVFGAALGGVFSMVFVGLHGRLGPSKPLHLAIGIALCGFLTLFLIPNLKYPANPPGTSLGDTIDERTYVYFGMIAICAIALVIACLVTRALAKHGALPATLAGTSAYAVCVLLAWVVLPSFNEVPQGFPQDLLLEFRLATIGLHAVIWATVGVAFGALASRYTKPSDA